MTRKIGLLLFMLLFFWPPVVSIEAQSSSVFISEFMASNKNTLADEQGDYPDWIELYNRANTEINLEGWYLTDKENNLTKWAFPAVTLAPDSYLLVFASGNDQVGAELHTNFSLKSEGEYLALVEPDGETIAWDYAPQYPAQFADVSYGLDAAGNERAFSEPTPGKTNDSTANLAPLISDVDHMPALPTDEDEINVTVQITQPEGGAEIEDVTLHYRVMFGEDVELPMFDDGAHGDGEGNDGVYGAFIGSQAALPGEMVRYYITAEDAEGNLSRWPILAEKANSETENANPTKPEYFGTMIADPSVVSSLPVLYWFVEDEDDADDREGTRAAVFYDGIFYDNVFVRLRGGSSIAWPKNSLKFDFNTGEFFKFSPDEAAVEEFNLQSTYSDETYTREVLAWETYRDAGVPHSISFPMRVQQNGEFYSVALFVEQPDERYLERQGLDPNGALYKMTCCNMVNRIDEGVNKRTRLDEDNSDLQALVDGVHLPMGERTSFLFDNLNLPAVINYLAAGVIMEDFDSMRANYYLYRDTEGTGEWTYLPWDRNWTFGSCCYMLNGEQICQQDMCENSDRVFWGDNQNHLTDAIYKTPTLRAMYLRRVRTLMDELLQPPNTPPDQLRYEQRLDEFLAQMESDVALDVEKWGFEWLKTDNLRDAIERLKTEYFAARRIHLYETNGPSGSNIIPAAQPDDATIEFGTIVTHSGDEDEEYLTLLNPNKYAVDISGWRIDNHIQYTFQPGTVIPARGTLYLSPNVVAFRNRATSPTGGEGHFVQGNYQGRLSSGLGSVELYNKQEQLITSQLFELSLTALPEQLIISELNYHPPASDGLDGDEFEFIKLQNVTNNTLSLEGLRFTDGIEYSFPATGTLEAKETLILARNPSALSKRYACAEIGGSYQGKLSNNGESITLVDKDNSLVTSLDYSNEAPWPTSPDGQGYTLIRTDTINYANHATIWQASNDLYGLDGIANIGPADCDSIKLITVLESINELFPRLLWKISPEMMNFFFDIQ